MGMSTGIYVIGNLGIITIDNVWCLEELSEYIDWTTVDNRFNSLGVINVLIYGHVNVSNHGYCTNPASDAYKVKDCPNCEFGTNDNNIGCNDVTPDFSKAGDPTGSTVCGFSSIIYWILYNSKKNFKI